MLSTHEAATGFLMGGARKGQRSTRFGSHGDHHGSPKKDMRAACRRANFSPAL